MTITNQSATADRVQFSLSTEYSLITDATIATASEEIQLAQVYRTYQASVTGVGALTATVLVEVSNNPGVMGWITLATITLAGNDAVTSGASSIAPWPYTRMRLTAIGGASATVNGSVGV